MVHWSARVGELSTYHRVFFSPHPEDVAFSCPGALLASRERGERALCVTLFSAAVPSEMPPGDPALAPQWRAAAEAAARRADRSFDEAAEAARRAGLDLLQMGLPRASLRHLDRRHEAFASAIWGETGAEGGLLGELIEMMGAIIARTQPYEVLVPLGVGRHIDHRLVFEAYRILTGQRERFANPRSATAALPHFWCYEDRPYALVDQATKMRLRELGFPVPLDPHRFFAAYWSAHYVRTVLTDPASRPEVGARYLESIQRPFISEDPPRFRVVTCRDSEALWKIVSAHGSLALALIGDQRMFEQAGKLEARRRRIAAPYAERQWYLSDVSSDEGITYG